MSSSGDEDVQVLHDQSREESFEDMDSGAARLKILMRHNYPSSPRWIHFNSLGSIAPKKTKSSMMAKVAETMKKQATANSSGKEAPPMVLDPQPTETEAVLGGSHSEPAHLSRTIKPCRKR
ncbi:hypothetical protein JCGZ_18435 [Jatropha curcas]|uniref:Uncharacterized protein n=1 Tax=Jatropha curcas TaxID=180498 RepID=A0A067KC95_JATCU|nr:hypothetical protein JCGZ_18435 [Jatropha curcas]